MTILERYSMEILAMGIFALLTWVAYTTYNNALALNTLVTKMEAFAMQDARLADNFADLDARNRAHEIRLQRLEDTAWSAEDHRRYEANIKEWIRDNFVRRKDD